MKISTLLLMLFTLIAFAANSILCRLALMSGSIGPLEFTTVRLGSGIVALLPLVLFRRRLFASGTGRTEGELDLLRIRLSTMRPALALFGYALFFSLAYVQLPAAAGALILFASVQITMIGVSIIRRERVTRLEWAGIVISFTGLIYLVSPGISAPPAMGTVMMIISGMCWGAYSLLGQRQSRPILSTARNFLFCLPAVVIMALIALVPTAGDSRVPMTSDGVLLAVLSGAVASGMGYVLWYLTVRRITTTVASVSQLVVPILAALGGVLFLSESLSFRLIIASILIVGGIVMTILSRRVPEPSADGGAVEDSVPA